VGMSKQVAGVTTKNKKIKNQTPIVDEQTNPIQNKNKANSFR
jgi:hypothetical protein